MIFDKNKTKIEDCKIDNLYIVADIGANHNSSMEIVKALIDKAKDAGCDAVKFQKRNPDISVPENQKKLIRDTIWGQMTYIDYRWKMELKFRQYAMIEKYCGKLNIDWFASVWDEDSIDFISEFDTPFIKVPSALITDRNLLERLNETDKPIIISTGMSTETEIDRALKILKNVKYILACTSTYPTSYDEVNLQYISTLKQKYPLYKIGYSNHAPSMLPCWLASVLGAEMIEFHITLDRAMWGTDQSSSIESADKLVEGIKKAKVMFGDGVKKVYESEKPILNKLRKINDT